MAKEFMEAVKQRRTYYSISKETTVTDERIQEIILDAVKHAPSPMNAQSARVVLLFGQHHDRLWDIVKETLRRIVPAEKFAPTEAKIRSFQSGYASVLYFEDMSVVEGLQEKYPAYQDNFPVWSHQSAGMLQFIIWTALEREGFGASLQHYNPLIDDEVKKEWDVPAHWKLIAQMPFGKPAAGPGEKAFQPLEARVKIYK